MRREIVRVDQLSRAIGKKQILNNFKFSIYDNEIVALIGERFCGKSLVGQIIAGLTPADQGCFYLGGEPVKLNDSYTALQMGIHHIGTDPKLIGGLSIADNFFVMQPGSDSKQIITQKKNILFSNEVLQETGLDFHADDIISGLSTTDNYLIQMAKAIANKARLVVIDDIFVGLSNENQDRLMNYIIIMKQKGISVLLIESDFGRAFAAAERIVIMKYGENMGEYYRNLQGVFDNDKIQHILTKNISYENILKKPDGSADKILELKEVSSGQRLMEVSFNLNAGSILGIISNDSSKYSELVDILTGRKDISSGMVCLNGRPVQLYHTDVQKEQGIYGIGNESIDDLLCENLSVLDNFLLSVVPAKQNMKLRLSASYLEFIYYEFSDKIGIQKKDWKRSVRFLRYDQKLRLLLYRALASGAKVIILDGIFRGQDLFIRQYLYKFMKEYTDLNRSIIFKAETADDIYDIAHLIYRLN